MQDEGPHLEDVSRKPHRRPADKPQAFVRKWSLETGKQLDLVELLLCQELDSVCFNPQKISITSDPGFIVSNVTNRTKGVFWNCLPELTCLRRKVV